MSAKSILGIMSLLLLLVPVGLSVNFQVVKATGTGYIEPSGLVGYWNFDKGSGTIASDSSGYNNYGTIFGASWTKGRINGALSFDGLNDYVDCGNNETLDPTQGATIEAWVNFKQLPSAAKHIMEIASRSGGGTDLDLQTETDNKFKFFIGTGAPNVAVSNTVVETNEWNHIVGTYQANSNIKIYVNGVLEKTVLIGITRNTNPNKFCIGQSGSWPGRFFNGTIDEVKIFNRALSAEEVLAEYMSVSILPLSGVVDVDQSTLFTSSVSGGTSPFKYQWYLSDTPVSDATSSSWEFTPHSSGSYTVYFNVTDNLGVRAKSNIATITVNPSSSLSPTSTSTLAPEPTGTGVQSDNSVATVSENSATVDQSASTGVSITVNGTSLQDDTQLNVTSTNYGNNQPEGTSKVSLDSPVFYSVDVISNGEALGSDVYGLVSLSDPSFDSASVIEYWNGAAWMQVTTTFTAPDTVSCIISSVNANTQSAIPTSALTGAPILVGAPKSNVWTLSLSAISLAIIIVVVVVLVAVLSIFFCKRGRRAK